jgi:hypothetical protein
MVGGTLEYLSLITGYRALLILAALLYLLSYLLGRTRRAGQEAARAPERVVATR